MALVRHYAHPRGVWKVSLHNGTFRCCTTTDVIVDSAGDFAYYTVQYLWYILLYMVYIVVLILIGSAVDIGFFRYNSYGLQIVSALQISSSRCHLIRFSVDS